MYNGKDKKLPWCPSALRPIKLHLKVVRWIKITKPCLRDFARFYGKTYYRILKQGPVFLYSSYSCATPYKIDISALLTLLGYGLLFALQLHTLPPNLVKFRNREIGCHTYRTLWNLTGISAALLPICQSNFRTIWKVLAQISRLRYFTRPCGKTSICLANRGQGKWYFTPKSHEMSN